MARKINAPGIEVNEIDRSNYEQTVDNSTIGTTTLVFGFADKGDDYTVRWINTMNTFVRFYGMPTNEAEKYFYNSVAEILNRGGVCYSAKLPYYNDSMDNFVYTSYTIDDAATELSSPLQIVKEVGGGEGSFTLSDLLFKPYDIQSISEAVLSEDDDFEPIQMAEFVDFVKKVTNFGFYSQKILDDVVLSSNVSRRIPTREFQEILNGDSKWYEYDGEYDDIVISDEVANIRDSIKDAFGEDVVVNDMVNQYSSQLYLDNFKNMYLEMAKKYGESVYLDDISAILDTKYTEIRAVDDSLTSYVSINADISGKNEIMSFENYDKFLIKELRVPKNKIYIVDRTRGKYDKDIYGNEILGIMPVIVTPANAMFYQDVIKKSNSILSDYNIIGKVRNSYRYSSAGVFDKTVLPFDKTNTTLTPYNGEQDQQFDGLVCFLGNENSTKVAANVNDFTISEFAAQYFPLLKFINDRVERKYLNQIGIVVFKVFRDVANENRIGFQPVESFVGSLDRKSRDDTTGERTFIDDVVNSSSDYINVFSNADIAENEDPDPHGLKNASIYVTSNQVACSMGFYQRDTRKHIHVQKSIYQPLLKIFEKSEDRNTLDFDIMIDGGVSNIAQFIASTQLYERNPETGDQTTKYVKDEFQRYGTFDFDNESAFMFRLDSANQCSVWRKVIERFDDFAKNTRKDIIFIADGPRPLCLEGNNPIVRRTKPENTIKNSILPKMKFISGVFNSSYSAGYLNWFYSMDSSTREYMWMPPSIKALGVYLYTDNNGAYWDAPAGLNRGRVGATMNIAFNPSNDEAGQIYVNSWNYAVSYPLDGIVLEGQRTFQREKTALDRVNVRRLMLGMEKVVRNLCKYFNYEGNTEYNRQRIKDLIDRYLEQVRANDGISQYMTVCDERNNTVETIENHELHITIAVRPIKTIEFIVLNFIATNQSVDVSEVIESELGT